MIRAIRPAPAFDHDTVCATAARAIHTDMMRREVRGTAGPVYVYFRPGEIRGFVDGAADQPGPGWILAWPERVPTDRTADQLAAIFVARFRRLPWLPPEAI